MARDSGSGLIIRPIGQALAALSAYGQQLFQAPPSTIRDIKDNSWYSPLQPIAPMAPAGTEPKGFQFWHGQNLLFTPRSDAEYTAADLKFLATYPLARICIENVKDDLCKTPWEIQLRAQPGESKKDIAERSKKDENLIKLNKFFEYPDREHNWSDWLRPLLEDLLVIDAASILIRKTFSGEIVEMPVIRGESIVRYIDDNGFTPVPPSPAYAQLWWGIPLVDLTTDQLIYRPRNIVPRNTQSSQLYGMSPTEQLAPEIQIGMQRLEFVKAYYTEGSVPGVVHVVPKGTPPDKITEAMQWMNSDLAGNLAARRQWRMVQGFQDEGKEDQILFTKEPLLADLYDEMHMRKIAFGYGASPQRLMKAMNRASAEQTDKASDVEGLLPWLLWLKGTIDYIIQRKMNLDGYEMMFNPFTEADPDKGAQTSKTLVAGGILTPNEARKRVGEEERTEPEANMLGIVTGSGFVPLGLTITAQPGEGGDGKDGEGKDSKGKDGKDKPKPKSGSENDPDSGDDKPKPKPGKRTNGNGKGTEKAHCAGHGAYDSNCLHCSTVELRRLEKLSSPYKAEAVLEKNHKKLRKRTYRPTIKGLRLAPHSIGAKRKLELALHNAFRKMIHDVTEELSKDKKKLSKANEDKTLKQIMKLLDLEWLTIPDVAEESLVDAAIAGAAEGALQVDIVNLDMMAEINNVARSWAEDRAAELVGMRWTSDGKLVKNPNAAMAISDSTRDSIKRTVSDVFAMENPSQAEIISRIEQSGIFSDSRAAMIARTEVSRSQNQGNLEAWRQSGVVKTVEWLISSDHDKDDECDEYADESPFDVDDVPDVPAHPNCDCVIVAGDIEDEE